jgi:DNA-3-methyladenine glycosylase
LHFLNWKARCATSFKNLKLDLIPKAVLLTRRRFETKHSPDPRLRFDPQGRGLTEFPREFFRIGTTQVAREIIGAWFARRYRNQWYGARIVETEAYLGSMDAAAHSRGGRRTPRVEPMYRNGGHLYVFFVYGMHCCANVVTGPAGIAEAVLLRAAEGPEGAPEKLLSGPGGLCAALGITVASSGIDLLSGGNLRLFQGCGENTDIGVSERIGVDYAGEAAGWLLRFFDRNSAAVSGPAHLKKTIRN